MYAYLEGKLTFKSPTQIYLDVGGVGYLLHITLNTFAAIESAEKTKLFTHLYVKEDILSLYGFHTKDEKEIFLLLLSVSGIGPNTARVVLSSMTSEEVVSAILHENVAAFNKVKGIGPKTAKRVILDLKDKVSKLGMEVKSSNNFVQSDLKSEAISALMSLGFNKAQIVKKIDHIIGNTPDIDKVEVLIKEVLKQMS